MKYVIDFYDHVSEETIGQYLTDNNITLLKKLSSFGNVHLVESANEIMINEIIEDISIDSEQGIELLNFSIDLVDNYTEATFDIEDEKNWWKVATINRIDFDQQINDHKVRGINSTVYIMDSGIKLDHPEFANANIELLHSFNDDFTDNKGHGTALSSLIVGPNCGLANPKLKVVKIFDTTQSTYQSEMLVALDAILNDFIANGRPASIVNMSWSIPKNEYINNKIQYMINQGIYVVASSGNNGSYITDVTPASIPDVLTIGSYSQNLTPSSFSDYTGGSAISYASGDVNYGALDGWAPGEMIWAANKDGGYGYIAGTSAAAAIASACVAYNVESFLGDSNQLEQSVDDNNINYMHRLGAVREGLLDLSDNRYASSVNKIVQVVSKIPAQQFTLSTLYVRAGYPNKKKVFFPSAVNTVSCTFLPSFLTVDTNGFIVIDYPEIQEEFLKLDQIEFDMVLADGNIGKYIIVPIVWKQSYEDMNSAIQNNYELLENDPELAITLAYGPGDCDTLGSETQCFENGCSDFSGGAVACSGGASKDPCTCI